jgi:hypothetical protein
MPKQATWRRFGRGIDRRFSNTHVFEKWSVPQTCVAATRAENEKGQEAMPLP